jgi:hypothetical protein
MARVVGSSRPADPACSHRHENLVVVRGMFNDAAGPVD